MIVLRTFNLGCVSTGLSAETHFEPCQSSKMELFAEIFNGFQPLTIFAKSFVLGVLNTPLSCDLHQNNGNITANQMDQQS